MTSAAEANEDGELAGRARRSAFDALGGQAIKAAIQVGSVVILSRMLLPEEFGLFGMIIAAVGVGHVLRDMGLTTATVRAASISHAERSNLWWINTAIGFAITVTVLLASPLIARFYDQPALLGLSSALSPIFLVNGMSSQYTAMLVREMRFRAIQMVDIPAALAGLLVCIVCAWSGMGVWSLVLQALVAAIVSLVLAVLACRWLPSRWDRGTSIRPFLVFGLKGMGSAILTFVGSNMPAIMMGRFHTAQDVGLLNRATQLAGTPVGQVVGPLSSLGLTVLSKLREDVPRLTRYAMAVQQAIGIFAAAICAAFFVAAEPIVSIALGDGWDSVVPYIRWVAVGTAAAYLPFVVGPIFNVRDRPGAALSWNLMTTAVRVIAIVVAASHSALAVVAVNALATVVFWPLSFVVLGIATQVPTGSLLGGTVRTALSVGIPTGITVAMTPILPSAGEWGDLLMRGGVLFVLFVPTLAIPAVRNDLRGVRDLILRRSR